MLEGVDHSDFLFCGAAEREVVYHFVLDYSVLVDEKQPSIGNHFSFDTHFAVGAGF